MGDGAELARGLLAATKATVKAKDARIAELERELALADGMADLGTAQRDRLERERDEARAERDDLSKRLNRSAEAQWKATRPDNSDEYGPGDPVFEVCELRDLAVKKAHEAIKRAESAEAEVARLREALEFYANSENWSDFTHPEYEPADEDKGERARRALQQQPQAQEGDDGE